MLLFSLGAFLLHAGGSLCLARTGAQPNPEYFKNKQLFATAVGETKARTQDALLKQFDTTTGFFTYLQHPTGWTSSADNDIRQLLASRNLALLARTDATALELHKQNLEAIFKEWYREEGNIGYVYAYEKSKLGGNAMLLRVLVASPSFNEYRTQAQRLVNSILALKGDDGSLRPWFKEPTYESDDDYLLTFYSGEAILALLEYAEKTNDARIFGEAEDMQEFYIEKYVTQLDQNYYPAYVPWHTLSLAELFEYTGDQKYADALLVLTDKILELQDRTEFVGRFFNPKTPEYGSPHVSSDAVYTEGLAVAYGVAREIGDEPHASRYFIALVDAHHNLNSLAYAHSWEFIFDDREAVQKLEGGLITNACNREIRIDNIAHTIDALTAIQEALNIK